MKHTPGPWSSENIFRMLSLGLWIGDDHSDDKANAALIAAAPEMLEMIQSLFCDPEGNPSFHGSYGDKEYFKKVLAKARGES